MKVLIVCEDPTLDQFVVRPIVQQIFDDLGRRVRLEVLRDPHLRGIEQVLSDLPAIVADNPMIDLFVVIVDRDGERSSNTIRTQQVVAAAGRSLACLAIEEVEVWMLALHAGDFAALGEWSTIRSNHDVKETVAIPWLRRKALGGPGHGRKAAMRQLGQGWRGVVSRCEELRLLREHIRDFVQ